MSKGEDDGEEEEVKAPMFAQYADRAARKEFSGK